jgi:SlyX protein
MSEPRDTELDRALARIVELEVRYTHQEKVLSDLSDVLYEQRRAFDKLVVRVVALEQKLSELTATPRVRDPKDDVPPHY